MKVPSRLRISFEKIVLVLLLVWIWAVVIFMGRVMPHQSAALLVVVFIAMHGILMALASVHRRRKLARIGGPTPSETNFQPMVSVVIPAHDEHLVIAETVRNMLTLNYPNYDVWVFDDRSTDGTADVLQALSAELPGKFNFVVRPPDAMPGKSAVLNDALAQTQGDIIAVFDADARITPEFLNLTVPYLAESGVGAVQSRKVIMNSKTNLLTRCQNNEYMLDAHFQVGRDSIRGAVELRGNGQLVKRQALQDVEGWTEDTLTDDLDLSTKLHLAGWDIRFAADAAVLEEGIIRFKPLLRQRRRWAEGSLKRYLEYCPQVLTSPNASQRTIIDMFAYFTEFIFPIWAVADLSMLVVSFLLGKPLDHLVSSLLVTPAVLLFFGSCAVVAVRNFGKVGFLPALWYGFETAMFLFVVWCPVVMWIVAKILVARDDAPLNWGKTEHLGTNVHVKRSRLERLKQLVRRSEA